MQLIPRFELGLHDRYSTFIVPSTLVSSLSASGIHCMTHLCLSILSILQFGREKELETIRNVIRHCTTSFARHYSVARPYIVMPSSFDSTGIGSYTGDDRSDSVSSRSEPSIGHTAGASGSHSHGISIGVGTGMMGPATSTVESPASPSAAYVGADQDLRRAALRLRHKVARVHALVVIGRSGYVDIAFFYLILLMCSDIFLLIARTGKSSLILANQTKWRCELFHSCHSGSDI
jgi:hypothetical protein